ncbi:MAG: DNA polymerase IV [Candidatus Latescibacteria bacterium]|jgi:DNA polymerase-4|nr:DNA polymerase IV [Candidatus Latescibacterota bacterium]
MAAHRVILHLDLDAFFCAVEEQDNPSLRGKAFAVGGRPEGRGVVASCSYAARVFGVRSAMPMARAVGLCKGLVIVPPRHGEYAAASRQVMERLDAITPLVEPVSIDEAFLDVSDCQETGEDLARGLQQTIREELSLPCSLGVATSKMVAKIANNLGKAAKGGDEPPNAITVVEPGGEQAFLAPLPVGALWGAGPKTAARLEQLGIHTIGDLAGWPEDDLVHRFGQHGVALARYAQGIDESPIQTEREAKSVSKETTFARDIRDGDALHGTLLHLSESVGRELRREQLSCRTVSIKFRTADFTTLTRQVTLEEPTDIDQDIYAAAKELFDRLWRPGQAVRLLGVGASRFDSPAQQLTFWEDEEKRHKGLQDAVDSLRERFGDRTVRWGSETLRDEGEKH